MKMKELRQLASLVEELKTTNSGKDKIAILKKHPECKNLLFQVYNRYYRFGVTSENARTANVKLNPNDKSSDLIDLLDALRTRAITGDLAIIACRLFARQCGAFPNLFWNIIDKDLKCGIDEPSINKAFPGLLPTFNVALAKSYNDHKDKVKFDGSWLVSRKLDGVRCLAILKAKDDIRFFSREGNEFTSLGNLREAYSRLFPFPNNTVIDGELCIIDADGIEDFKASVSQIKRKNFTIKHPRHIVFDMLTLDEFEGLRQSKPLMSRYNDLTLLLDPDDPRIERLLQKTLISEDVLTRMKAKADKHGWEGLMLRKNSPYEGKRTSNLLKVKKFLDAEFVVQDVQIGTKQMMVGGKKTEVECMSSVGIEYKGHRVDVGSGWSDHERISYMKNPKRIIGQTITVSYFEETKDADGIPSLRFPTVKIIHGDRREV
jgi:DNA ligase-1